MKLDIFKDLLEKISLEEAVQNQKN